MSLAAFAFGLGLVIGTKYCQAVIGPVVTEANSRIPLFLVGEGFHLRTLMNSAIDHFDAVTAG